MKKLSALFIPICFETLFYMLSGMVDTLMLSSVGDYAVGAVGTACVACVGGVILRLGRAGNGVVKENIV